MNTIKTLQLAGIYRLRKRGPGFGIPVFSHDGQYWVQEISSADRVMRFVTCDLEPNSIRILPSPTDPPIQSAGQQALYAFEATDDTMKLGTREEVVEWLRDRLAEFQTTPFVLHDVAEFLGDSALIIEAQERCDAILKDSIREGEKVYQAHKEKWDQLYAGRYIAIYEDDVIAIDTKKTKLTEKILKEQTERGPFRACIMNLVAGGKKP